MPTLNNDFSAVAVNPLDEAAAKQRSRRIVGVSLGATLITVLILFAAMALAVDANAANTCTLTSTAPITLWGDATKWSSCGGTYPGQGAGDTAIVSLGGSYTLRVDAFNNPVVLQISTNIPIQIASGGTLTLETSSTATTGDTFTVDTGGTMGTNTGANITNFFGNVTMNGGTFNSQGSIQFGGTSVFTFAGGSLNGPGSITSGSAQFTGSAGAMFISQTIFNDSSSLTFSSTSNTLNLNTGAKINVLGSAFFNLQNDAAIAGSATESIVIASGGTMQKSSGTGFNSVSCLVKNDGTVSAAPAGAGGGIGLSGGGIHTGSFVTGSSSQTIAFDGSHVFNSGSFTGGSPIKIIGGTSTFNASITASTGLKWMGGTIAGTGPLNVSGNSFLDGGNSAMTLTGVINNTGTMTYSPSVSSHLLSINGGTARLETTGSSFTIAGDFDIQAVPSGAGVLRVTGGTGSLTKNAGASGSSILAYLDNASGTITNSSTGALNVAGGGISIGTMSVPSSGNTFNFTGGTFNDTGSYSGSGTINVAGGTLNINTARSFGSGGPNFNISAGTLGGTATVSLLGASTWSGGTVTGSGPLNVSSTGVLTLTGANGPMTLDGRVLSDSSSVIYNSSTNNLTLKNSASILNTGTFTATGTGLIDTDGSAVFITNNGQFNKTSSGIFVIKPTFNMAGSGASITGGVLDIVGAGTSSATFTLAGTSEVWFRTLAALTYTWAAGTAFTGATGKVTVEGSGTVATGAAMTINNTNLEVTGGTFNNAAAFTVTAPGTFAWKGGTLSGAGHFIVSAGTTTDATTVFSSRTLNAKIFDNSGTFNLNPTSMAFDGGATFNNFASATFDIQGDGFITSNNPGATNFFNTGTVQKSTGSSGFRFDMAYSQTGGTTDSQVAGGTIIFNAGGGLSAGTFKSSNATANIDFFNGTFNLNGGTLNGPGPGPIRITGGIVQVNTALSATNFAQNAGTLQGTSDLTITSGGKYTWNGGTMASSGQLVIASGATLDVAGGTATPLVLSSQVINNSGTTTYHPLAGGQGNQLTLSGTGSIVNQSGAAINVTDNSSFLQSGGGTTIVNSGNFLTSGSSSVAPTINNNPTGLIKPTGGMLSLLAGTSNGTLDAVSPGAINFGGGATFTITGGTWGGSGGGFWVTGGTVTINSPFSLSGLALNSGQIDGPGTLTLTGSNAWGGGTMAGSGTTANTGTLAMSNNLPSFLDTRTFNNSGTVNYVNGGNSLQLKNGAVFNNSNLFDVQGDVPLTCNCSIPGLFHNIGTGTVQKLAGTGNAIFTPPFNNDGSVAGNLGTLQFTGGGTHNGSFSAATGGSIAFSGASNTFNAPSTLTGAGNIGFAGAATINSGTVTPGTFTINNGNVTLNSNATVGTLNLHNAAILGGPGTVLINGTASLSEWTGGTMQSGGAITVNFGSQFQLDGLTAAMTLNGRQIINNGTLSYNSTTNGLVLTNSAVITNSTGATLNLDASPGIGASGINNVISNAGLMQRNSAGTLGISPAVTNTGTINANNGELAFNGGLTQTSGSTKLLGGSISSPSTIALSGGTLTGNGTVSAAVNNTNGIVAPGNPSTAGTITITGPYAQGVNAGMSLKIGGTSNYDIVDASASGLTLGGTLTVSLFNAFTPASGNTFDILKFSTRSGDFANYFLPTFGGGGSFQNAYVAGSPNVLRLTAVVTASDLQITQVAPSSVLHGQNGTWTLTITNGPTPVTNVVVTDNFANATFVSATSVGPCTPSGSTVTCNLGSLAANQSVNVSLILNAPNLVTISNSASVTATEFDPNTANNNVGPTFTPVLPAADLSITNTASSNPANAGSPLSFTLTVFNAGPDASGSLTISNTFPPGVTGFTFSGAGWTCGPLSGSTTTCSTATSIGASSSAPALVLSIVAPATGPANDSASVSGSTGDPNGGNNSASQSVTITAQADLSITKNGPASVIAGQNIVYTVVATNNGPSTATGVTVTDPQPAGATFVSNSGGCASAYPCALGNLTNGQSVTITSTYSTSPGSAGATVTNTATVASPTSDPSAGNNSATKSTSINGSADVTITKTGPAFSIAGSPIVYTITVTNNGPSDAASVVVSDPDPAGTTFVSNAGACTTPFPCTLGTVTAGQTKTITSTFNTPPSFAGSTVTNTATVTTTTPDPNAGNNSGTAVTSFSAATADLSITKTGPVSATNGSTVTYTLTVANNGPATATNVVVSDPTPAGLTFFNSGGACSGAFPCSLGNLTANQSVTITASYTVTATSGSVTNSASVAGSTTDPNPGNDFASATTTIGTTACNAQPPSLTAPSNGSTVSSPVTFSWTAVAGATSYKVFASIGGASTQEIGSTSATTITLPISGGTVVWSVQAFGVDNCNQLVSANGTFNVCNANTAPVLSVVGTSSSGQSYTVQWTDIPGVGTYELQEASNEAFGNPVTFQVSGLSRGFTKTTPIATAFFYRVRALSACGQGPGPFSAFQRVVVVPVPPIEAQSPSATVDINNKHVVVQTVFIPGQGSALPFTATTDEPWLTVTPSSGILPAAGLTLNVSADPADLPNGTFTATIILTFPGAPGKVGALDAKPAVTVPVSISVVTPVSPSTLSSPPANALIIPSVGHLDGINSQWRSDVRITNTAPQKINYLLRFTPAGGDPNAIKQTQVSIAANDTMALDDIVKNWYGVGALGDAANGVLEIRPLNTSGKGSPNAEDVNVSLVTVASSRTFNQSAGGTLGQYIPAIPFANFMGKVTGDARAGILSLQQIAQSPTYRTNLGIVEAAGKATSVLVSVFDAAGKNVLDIPIDLKAGEQQQLNSFLAAKNIVLTDGRVEVKVTSGEGKVTAYASVVDNKTTDPLLVSGVPLVQTPARSFVLPGVADLSNGLANWRTDMRIFNSGIDPQYVTMTLFPLNDSSGATISRSLTVNPGEVTVLDNVLASRFGLTNVGGALHVDTLTDANLVVTGRTYNLIDGGGTYGQYISAITPADGVPKGGRTLNVLQVEDSSRYRTNLGIAEVSGKPVTVEVSVFLPDAKVAPKVTIPMAANEYRQFRVLQQLGVGTAYNARISIKVVDGEGRITAYGSVIDMQTQDPTYVPAQ